MNILHGKKALVIALALGLLAGLVASAQEGHLAVNADELQWQPGPASLPPGAEWVLLTGNPSEEGPITMRLRFPAGYEVPPHSHPALEHVTVLSGTFNIGVGETFDKSQGTALDPGGFYVVPIGHAHYAWVDEDTVLQLHSNGPWGITYLNPEDDPRNQ